MSYYTDEEIKDMNAELKEEGFHYCTCKKCGTPLVKEDVKHIGRSGVGLWNVVYTYICVIWNARCPKCDKKYLISEWFTSNHDDKTITEKQI